MEKISKIKWVTRAPKTPKEARKNFAGSKREEMSEIAEGYRVYMVSGSYSGCIPEVGISSILSSVNTRELSIVFLKHL